jgi:hypothetical protein
MRNILFSWLIALLITSPVLARDKYLEIGDWGGSLASNDGLRYAMNDNTDRFDMHFVSEVTMNVSNLSFGIYSKTGTPVAYNFTLQTDNAGLPSGTLAWAGSYFVTPANMTATWQNVSIATPGQITRGTKYHIVMAPETDPAGTNYVEIGDTGVVDRAWTGLTYSSADSGSTWSARYYSAMALWSNDTPVIKYGQTEWAAKDTFAISNTTWAGNNITALGNYTISGGSFKSTTAGNFNLSIFLIDSSNTILANAQLNRFNMTATVGSFAEIGFVFNQTVNITNGSYYRLVVKNTGGAACNLYRAVYNSADASNYTTPLFDKVQFCNGTSADSTSSPTTWTDVKYKYAGISLFAEQPIPTTCTGGSATCSGVNYPIGD